MAQLPLRTTRQGLAVYGVTNVGGASNAGAVFTLQCAKPVREVFGGAQHAA